MSSKRKLHQSAVSWLKEAQAYANPEQLQLLEQAAEQIALQRRAPMVTRKHVELAYWSMVDSGAWKYAHLLIG